MTACIGWIADPPCVTHGPTHGCRHGERHGGQWHGCDCGAKVKWGRGRAPIECGTRRGYNHHKQLGEPPCDLCREARNAIQREWQAKKRNAA